MAAEWRERTLAELTDNFDGTTTSVEYAVAMRVPSRTALNHLKHFSELGLVRRLGSGRSTRYEVTRP